MEKFISIIDTNDVWHLINVRYIVQSTIPEDSYTQIELSNGTAITANISLENLIKAIDNA